MEVIVKGEIDPEIVEKFEMNAKPLETGIPHTLVYDTYEDIPAEINLGDVEVMKWFVSVEYKLGVCRGSMRLREYPQDRLTAIVRSEEICYGHKGCPTPWYEKNKRHIHCISDLYLGTLDDYIEDH